jgi:AmmeMemoRadiSam system protein A
MFPQPEKPSQDNSNSEKPSDRGAEEFSSAERTQLLKWAHEAISAAAAGRQFSPEPGSTHLAEPRGVFTTLYLHGELRGCVGYPAPVAPLYRAVVETAQAAAFEDQRFPRLRANEVAALEISLSILSRLESIQPEAIEIGRHGLVISAANQRGLLLPQVPVERGWDRTMFLEQTCQKAGLPTDAWQHGATLEAFTAEVFGDLES